MMAPQHAPRAAAVFACQTCSKSFPRRCDLNKHSKTHTRPYKCSEVPCKYHTIGWPTAKELERHNNDRHADKPVIHSCHFCTYTSRRKSNCKQHMEKAHSYIYVRTKPGGKRAARRRRHRAGSSAPSSGADADKHDDDNSSNGSSRLRLEHQSSGTSFAARIPREDSNSFNHFFDALGPHAGDDDNALDQDDADYDNARPGYLPWNSPGTRLRDNESLIEKFDEDYDSFQGNLGNQAADFGGPGLGLLSPALISPTAVGGQQIQEGPRSAAAGQVAVATARPPARAALSTALKRPGSPSDGDGDDDPAGPLKKQRPNPGAEPFTDLDMPDIFRYAHPGIYDRERSDKYVACHTLHREVSTLVRHLGRPSHCLKVSPRLISSFDMPDTGFRHRRVGVCRFCWTLFSDREAFAEHVSKPCQRVSKGKLEKWRIIHDSFTPLADSTRPDSSDTLAGEEGPSGEDSHAARELDRLQREHEELRRRNAQLEQQVAQLVVPAGTGAQNSNMMAAAVSQGVPNASTAPSLANPGRFPAPSSNNPGRSPALPALPDRDSLVRHMDSQPTNVNVQGFVREVEDAHRSISPTGSARSSASRATIHRVPPSPPPRPTKLPSTPGDDRQPPVSDSGYGTEKRFVPLGVGPGTAGPAATAGSAALAGRAPPGFGFGPVPPAMVAAPTRAAGPGAQARTTSLAATTNSCMPPAQGKPVFQPDMGLGGAIPQQPQVPVPDEGSVVYQLSENAVMLQLGLQPQNHMPEGGNGPNDDGGFGWYFQEALDGYGP